MFLSESFANLTAMIEGAQMIESLAECQLENDLESDLKEILHLELEDNANPLHSDELKLFLCSISHGLGAPINIFAETKKGANIHAFHGFKTGEHEEVSETTQEEPEAMNPAFQKILNDLDGTKEKLEVRFQDSLKTLNLSIAVKLS